MKTLGLVAVGATGALVVSPALPAYSANGCDASVTDVASLRTVLASELSSDRLDPAVICVSGTFLLDAPLNLTIGEGSDHPVTIKGVGPAIFKTDPSKEWDAVSQKTFFESFYNSGLSFIDLTFINEVTFAVSAIRNSVSSEVQISGSSFKGFTQSAVYVDGDIVVSDTDFEGKSSSYRGGAIVGKSIVVSDGSTFVDNFSEDGAGGAIASLFPGSVTISDSEFRSNQALNGPGGAVSALGDVVIRESIFVSNSAAVIPDEEDLGAGDGGAIWGLDVSVFNSTFVSNEAENGGGLWAEDLRAYNSTFVNNLADVNDDGEGGAIYVGSAGGVPSGEVFFSTFLNNSAAPFEGTGDGEVTPDRPGDAIYLEGGFPDPTSVEVGGNIFAHSSAFSPQLGVGEVIPGEGEFVDSGGNLFSTADDDEVDLYENEPALKFTSSSFMKSPQEIFGWSDPGLADSGGITQTVALRPGALAVDFVQLIEGNPDSLFPDGEDQTDGTDQRGRDRDNRWDAGAFELTAADLASGGGAPGGSSASPTSSELARTGPNALGLMGLATGLLLALGSLAMATRSRFTGTV